MTSIIVGIFWIVLLFGLIIWNIYDHIIRLDKQNKEQQLFINELIERSKSQLDISNGVLDCLQDTVNTFKKEIKELKELKDTFTILKLAKQYGIEVVPKGEGNELEFIEQLKETLSHG